jgi:hypothetical protein
MTKTTLLASLAVAGAVTGILAAPAVLAQDAPAGAKPAAASKASKKKQVLFFTKSSGFEHSVIKQKDGQPSHAETILKELGEKNGFEVTHSKDGAMLAPESLKKWDAFVLFTTGDLTQPGNDKNPPMPDKQAFLDAIKGGKGLVGIHAASDTFHTPGEGAERFAPNGDNADPFVKMLGGEFIRHGQQQTAKVFCVDPKFPGLAACKDKPMFELHDEWYALKNIAKDMHVLMYLGTYSLKNTGGDSVYRRAPYPVTWARKEGKGRVFYTALGHREDVWTNPLFQEMLVGGIKWASGAANATLKKNVAQVTPGFEEVSPQDPPPEKKTAAAPAAPASATKPTAAAPAAAPAPGAAPGAPAAPKAN